MREAGRRVLIALALCGARPALAAELDAAVTAVERGPADADALFTAARACEEKLHDPARALALYERLVRERPDARDAVAAGRRVAALRAELGAGGEHAAEAAALARLVAEAEDLDVDVVAARAEQLAAAPWPGAPGALLWLAEHLRRRGRLADAARDYAEVSRRWPGTLDAELARRGAAGCAIDARDWDLAERLARGLPAASAIDVATRDELLAAAARGRRRDRTYAAAWVALALAVAGLVGSLVEAALRGGRQRPALRPPVEVWFFAPVAAVLVAVSFTAHRAIAPAVTWIAGVGLGLAWLSGTGLDLARARGRTVRGRAVLHIAACAAGVVAVGYIAITRSGLLDMLVETVRFGPE